MAVDQPTTVITPIEQALVSGAQWQPFVEEETYNVIQRNGLSEESGGAVIEAAASILSRGAPPNELQASRTGLVVGYVQSGKTLSFTTVIALARDNGYRLIIVVAGTSTALLEQSTQRLRYDLNIDAANGYRRWSTFKNPDQSEGNWRRIVQAFEEWQDPEVPKNERPTVLITVMKNHRHLANLSSLLDQLDLYDVPTLIIDDEADQASLNTLVNRNQESTTYRRLLELREKVQCHTFLQYTATPQAPLLINIIDALSPDFVEVLEPGEEYVGGRSFFFDTDNLVSVIPYDDVPTKENPLEELPDSLIDALRVFLMGVAAGLIQERSNNNTNQNRSMLVHPSRTTAQHQEYLSWIGQVFDEWSNILKLPDSDPDREDLLYDFSDARKNLAMTVPDLPTFDELKASLPRALRLINIEEVNAREGRTPSIDWNSSYGWILIGGQAMDRGFTVEGLTVTYMPRGPGVGNADTIQQRGRFFGYKRRYLGYCRTYLEQEVRFAFSEYVDHEEEMRRQLQKVRDSGTPLNDWKRAFVLSPDLQPCRSNVIHYKYVRGHYADKWFSPRTVLSTMSIINENQRAVKVFSKN